MCLQFVTYFFYQLFYHWHSTDLYFCIQLYYSKYEYCVKLFKSCIYTSYIYYYQFNGNVVLFLCDDTMCVWSALKMKSKALKKNISCTTYICTVRSPNNGTHIIISYKLSCTVKSELFLLYLNLSSPPSFCFPISCHICFIFSSCVPFPCIFIICAMYYVLRDQQ